MPKSNKNKILNIFEDADKNNTLFVSEDDFIENGFPLRNYLLRFLGDIILKMNVSSASKL